MSVTVLNIDYIALYLLRLELEVSTKLLLLLLLIIYTHLYLKPVLNIELLIIVCIYV